MTHTRQILRNWRFALGITGKTCLRRNEAHQLTAVFVVLEIANGFHKLTRVRSAKTGDIRSSALGPGIGMPEIGPQVRKRWRDREGINWLPADFTDDLQCMPATGAEAKGQ